MGSVGENAEMFKMKKKLFYQNFIFKLTSKSDRFEHKTFWYQCNQGNNFSRLFGIFLGN